MVGVGLCNPITLKLYAELTSTTEVLSGTYLNADAKVLFKTYSGYHIKNVSSSLAVGVKVNTHSGRRYFHIKLIPSAPIQEFSKRMKWMKYLGINIKELMKGISYEFAPDFTLSKSYYYIEQIDDIAKFIALRKLAVNINAIEHIELYFTENDCKYNLIFKQADTELSRSLLTPEENRKMDSILTIIQQPILYVGRTKHDTTAYFSFTNIKSPLFD
jgi:hypothetical protein